MGHVGRSQPVELALDEGRQRVQRGVVSIAPGYEELCDTECAAMREAWKL
jgi:hypothetical protein